MSDSFSTLQRAVIRHLAAGFTPPEVARLLRVTTRQIKVWLADPEFAEAVNKTVASHDAQMRDFLLYGEEVAVSTALDVMQNAVDGKGQKDYKTRLTAAIEFLNRRGNRGAPVQVAETKNLNLSGNVNDALASALRDPGVQAWLDGEPEVLKALTTGETPRDAAGKFIPYPIESDFEIDDGQEDP